MSGRSQDFWLDPQHPLSKGLVFAGLGRFPKSKRFTDSSLHKNTGTLTNFASPNAARGLTPWGTPCLKFGGTGSTEHVPLGITKPASGTISLSVWWIVDAFDAEPTPHVLKYGNYGLFVNTFASNRIEWRHTQVAHKSTAAVASTWYHSLCVHDVQDFGHWLNADLQEIEPDEVTDAITLASISESGNELNGRVADVCVWLGRNMAGWEGYLSDRSVAAEGYPVGGRPWIVEPRTIWPVSSGGTPLAVTDTSFNLESPYANDDEVGTVSATGGTTPYAWDITATKLGTALVFKVTGTLSPDATGLYVENGTYNGVAAFERADGSYWMWFDGVSEFVISTTKGDDTDAWAGAIDSMVAQGTYTGTATAVSYVPFKIGAATGTLAINDATCLEVDQVWNVTVRVTDDATDTDTEEITITCVAGAGGSVTDGVSAGDSLVAALLALASASEGAQAGDAQAATLGALADLTDGALAGDSFAGALSADKSTSEGSLAGDIQSASATLRAAIVEGAAAGEQWAVALAATAAMSDGALTGDSFTALVSTSIQAAIAEGSVAGETFAAAVLGLAAITEGATAGDAMAAVLASLASVTEGAQAGDAWTIGRLVHEAVSEGAIASDSFAAQIASYVTGPYYSAAGQVYSAGAVAGQVYAAGSAAGQVYSAGAVAGQIIA